MVFKEQQKQHQLNWWRHYSNQPNWDKENEKWGKWGKLHYDHIVKGEWSQLIWPEIRDSLAAYLGGEIQTHSATNNLLSSWVACANLYFPVRSSNSPEFKKLMTGFLQQHVSKEVVSVEDAEMEYALQGALSPEQLLGEEGGKRGSGQTSPDVAFMVKTIHGKGLILVECKYTEKDFYKCSARTDTGRKLRKNNPDAQRCMGKAILTDYSAICHQRNWGRTYLDLFSLTSHGKSTLNRCPAATSGYQLLRQQALANGIHRSGQYDLVISAVAFDNRNRTLIKCLENTGISDFQLHWDSIYEHGAGFATWHHQQWVDYVRRNATEPYAKDWVGYIESRYSM